MKRILAATVLTAAAVATLAGCTADNASDSNPLVFTTDNCSKLEAALGKSIDGFALQSDSKLGDKGGRCTWTHAKTGNAIFVDVDDVAGSGDEAKTDDSRDAIANDKSLTVIDNAAVEKFHDGVLSTPKGAEKSTSRTFTAQSGTGAKVTLITGEVAMSNAQASDIFTALFTG